MSRSKPARAKKTRIASKVRSKAARGKAAYNHISMAGRDPHSNAGWKSNHRGAKALITAVTRAAGAVAAIRTRMSRPSSIVSAGTSVPDRSPRSGAITTSANPVAALLRSRRHR